jgi:hypothetical protein
VFMETWARQGNNDTKVSTQGHTVDALPQSGEEGRDYLRKATGNGKYILIRGYPNGATQLESCPVISKEKPTQRIETS